VLVELETLKDSGGTWPRPLGRSQTAHFGASEDLERELGRTVRGEVRFDSGSRAMYATDASNYRQVPIGVVTPRDAEDVEAVVAACRRYGAPVLSRGGGTSLAGQCCNAAVVMDMTKFMHHVVEIDPARKRGRAQPGCVLDRFRNEAIKHGLTFGPDPATHNHCTLGGMAGNNSCGMHAQMAGRMSDNTEELEILTYDGLRMRVGATSEDEIASIVAAGGRRGEIYQRLRDLRDRYADLVRKRYPRIPRRISGYNLDDLLPERGFNVARALVGSESTCVTILEVVGRLIPNPPVRTLLVLGYPSVYEAGDHVPEVNESKPIACEGIDDRLLGFYRRKGVHLKELALMPEGGGWLILEYGGQTKKDADDQARALMNRLSSKPDAPTMKLYDDPEQERMIWETREASLGATAFVPGFPDTWPGWEDSAVAPEQLGAYLRDLRALFDKHGYQPSLYGHFGQACVHCRVPFDLVTEPGIRNFRSFMDEATTLVTEHGGSLSGEHGDGQARAEFLGKMFGPELLEAFREFKSIWDPEWKMNPGKVVDPHPIDSNLRLGTGYSPPQPRTHFHYPSDDGQFSRATLRCVGVGKCRREEGGTMCPSYMVTHEEMHSTRGRARLLFEMMQGNPLEGGWRDEHVREALDLCLSCKGCKGECPLNVDMATYKAEFLSHYYERRLRPRSAYASGLIFWWARMASRMPRLANFATHAPGLSHLAKFTAGYSQKRTIPRFATHTFREWFARRGERNAGGQPVILWADTFNNYFTPEVAQAAVEVLESAGFRVEVPSARLCCGRPLYDYGMLNLARKMLERTLGELRPRIRAGVPVVGLEPSCVSVFREEMPNLLWGDFDAGRLHDHTFLLSEFLEKHAPGFKPPRMERDVLVHGHCHHKAVLDFRSEQDLLGKMGLRAETVDSGCCGMAGAFGYESDHYETGLKCGERALLPAVRAAGRDQLIVTDGFSCREMILQETSRRPLHVAQVMQMALRGASRPLPAERPRGAPGWMLASARAIGRVAGAARVLASGTARQQERMQHADDCRNSD
jgi:FAD/FMN-containing dehydrogenase/Fe-S oxidoreductase